MKKILVFLAAAALLLLPARPAMAMDFQVNENPFFEATNNADGGSGDSYSTTVSSTGEKLVFRRYFQDSANAYVKLETKDGAQDLLSFPVPSGRTLKIYKVNGTNPDCSFWYVALMKKTHIAVSGQNQPLEVMEYFWLVGPYKDRYVSFVTRDTLWDYDIDMPDDGTLLPRPTGKRNRLNLEVLRLLGPSSGSATFSWVYLQWNEEDEWFSISKTQF